MSPEVSGSNIPSILQNNASPASDTEDIGTKKFLQTGEGYNYGRSVRREGDIEIAERLREQCAIIRMIRLSQLRLRDQHRGERIKVCLALHLGRLS